MRVALDTNRVTDLLRGDVALARFLEAAERVWLPFVVVAELRAGFALSARAAANERDLARLLGKPDVDVLYASDATTRAYAALYKQLRAAGTPIPTNDLWIAALVVEHALSLCTRDEHFAKLPQLTIV